MSERLSHNSTKAAAQQERAELAHEVKDFVNVDSKGRAHVPTGSGRASGNFLSDHELKMINAHKEQIEDGLEARNADYIINRLISHDGENELTDPAEVRDALVAGLDDLDLEDYDDEEIMQFVEDKRRELAEYNGTTVAEKQAPSVETDSSNPEIEQLKAENTELRAELAEMRKAIAELTAALKGEAPDQGFDVDAEVEAAKARLSETADAKAKAAIDAINSSDQAKADKALLDDDPMADVKITPEQLRELDAAEEAKKADKVANGRFDTNDMAELRQKLAEEDAAEQSNSSASLLVSRMDAISGQTGNASEQSGASSLVDRMDAIANASTGTNEPALSSSSRGVRARDWLRHPLASASERAVNARSGARTEREGNNNRSRRKKLLAGFVLFGGAIGGGLLLMKGHDIFSYSIGGNGGNGGLDGIKDIPTDIPTDGPGKKTGGGNGGNEILTSVRVKPGDGEIKVTQSILEQQGIHVNTTDAQRIGEHANVDLLLRDNNYNDTSSTLDRIGAGPGTYDIRPGSAEALIKSARELGFRR